MNIKISLFVFEINLKKIIRKFFKHIIYISISFLDFLICINNHKKIKKM